ncbi:hypothetical protein CP985_13600 [Malaciobacter mytili LMG 24559]|uniref:Uncharacterized protein n=1 Tax=Malaciobacter mytili LMG 24559 TaxID=1032238 RepID=A0AAX2AG21_9BACT|nr:hypothetical protein [Malaciobacter mytili]AXH16453.1 hypothetical protein AMYT_a0155 [Malaciobacter mytili LMG 24559]RXK12985.1 hypothetical protein CP985_13600 [Malaciobacter mytili LMG 24559]
MKKIALSLVVLGGLLNAFAEKIDTTKFDSLFDKYSKVYSINANFIKKIATLESGLDENKVTLSFSKNDKFVGLFQISEKFYNVDSKKIDNEDITNKAVKQMRYCLDKKGYTIEMINCFNKSYTDEDKKILLSLLNKNMQ